MKNANGRQGTKHHTTLIEAVIGLAVAAIVGLMFGLYPASQTTKKSPVEALRYE